MNFFSLPRELRDQIYEHILAPPLTIQEQTDVWSIPHHALRDRSDLKSIRNSQTTTPYTSNIAPRRYDWNVYQQSSLLLANKQIRQEGLETIHRKAALVIVVDGTDMDLDRNEFLQCGGPCCPNGYYNKRSRAGRCHCLDSTKHIILHISNTPLFSGPCKTRMHDFTDFSLYLFDNLSRVCEMLADKHANKGGIESLEILYNHKSLEYRFRWPFKDSRFKSVGPTLLQQEQKRVRVEGLLKGLSEEEEQNGDFKPNLREESLTPLLLLKGIKNVDVEGGMSSEFRDVLRRHITV